MDCCEGTQEVWQRANKARGGAQTTRDEWAAFVRKFAKDVGKDDPRDITENDARAWSRALESGLAPITVHARLSCFRAICRIGIEERLLDTNPFEHVRVRGAKAKASARGKAFPNEIAAAILAATLREKHPARRWVPWLCAFTGSRVSAIVNLRGKDIVQVDGIWCLDINREASPALKNAESARTVAIHSVILKQGFLEFVKSRGEGRLFYGDGLRNVRAPQFKSKERSREAGQTQVPWNPGKGCANHLREWLHSLDLPIGREHGLDPNHGWRHWIKRAAADVGIEDRTIDAIVGHAPATVGSRYGGVSVRAMKAALEHINPPAFSDLAKTKRSRRAAGA